MPKSPYVFDTNADNFPRLVLENSAKGPVLVNYWSPKAGPCMMLMPRLVRLAGEFGGRFLLVMLNTDEMSQLARSHGVVSLPTVKVYRHGKVVDTLHGAESEDSLRNFIRKQLAGSTDTLLLNALGTHAQGDTASAVRLAAEAALADPQNTRIPLELAKLLVLQGRYAQADDLLQALPVEVREELPELHQLAAHVSVLRTARDAPPVTELEQAIAANPDNLEARYQLSAVQLVANDYDAAMQQLLEIARRDRDFRHGAGHAGLHALFELLGEDDERVRRYRALLQADMHLLGASKQLYVPTGYVTLLKLSRGHQVLIGADAVAAVLFGVVKRLVGSIEKRRRHLAGGYLNNTDADRLFSDLRKVVHLHDVTETLQDREGLSQFDILQDDDKFLSTVAEQIIIRSK